MIKELKLKAPVKKELKIEVNDLKNAALILRAINHPLRQKFLHFIHKNRKISVSEIYSKLRIEQSVTSQHLALLRKAGFVNANRDGQNIFYTVNNERLKEVEGFAKSI